MADGARELTSAELRHVLSHPEDFGLKHHVWYALDANAAFIEAHPQHCLARRLGATAAQLEALFEQWWLAGANTAFLEAKQPAKQAALRQATATTRPAPLEVSIHRSTQLVSVGAVRKAERIRYATAWDLVLLSPLMCERALRAQVGALWRRHGRERPAVAAGLLCARKAGAAARNAHGARGVSHERR